MTSIEPPLFGIVNSARLFVPHLTSIHIESVLKTRPHIILPVCALEPFGSLGEVGVLLLIARALTHTASEQTGVLVLPEFCYGYNIGLRSFAGCVGTDAQSCSAALFQILRGLALQGVRKVFIVDTTSFGKGGIEPAVKRLGVQHPELSATLFTLTGLLTGAPDQKNKPVRDEYCILSVAAFLSAASICPGTFASGSHEPQNSLSLLSRWFRRGKDPQQFKKHFPDGLTSGSIGEMSVAQGSALFWKCVNTLIQTLTQWQRSDD